MQAELSRLMGELMSSPLWAAIVEKVHGYFDEDWLLGMDIRWIESSTIANLPRRDKIFTQQCRQSYLVAENLEFDPPYENNELREIISEMEAIGVLGGTGEDAPPSMIAKYPDYLFYPAENWEAIGRTGTRLIVQVGEAPDNDPVVVLSEAEGVEWVGLFQATIIQTLSELAKFSQDPITS
jgi:hypothetical protein